ncbi:MAG: hypothetical protein N2235_11310 [Fischerella sp.]|nr:hypothetical protein [Fischerella sp.]
MLKFFGCLWRWLQQPYLYTPCYASSTQRSLSSFWGFAGKI